MSRRAKRRKRRIDKASPQQAEKARSLQIPANLLEVPTELLESLPKETQVAYIQAASFRGPLPPPVLFGQYEEILKGAADRMIQLAEREQLHRQSWEMAILRLQGRDIRRGQWMGFVLGALGIIAAVVCAYLDKPYIAGLSIGTVIAGILTAYFRQLQHSNSDD